MGGQLIYDKNKIVGVLDFDYMKLDYPEYDLVRSAMIFGFHHTEKGFKKTRFNAFLNAYKSVMGEIDLKPREALAFLRYSNLSGLSFFIEKYEVDKSNNELSNIKGFMDLLDWINQNEEMIVELFI